MNIFKEVNEHRRMTGFPQAHMSVWVDWPTGRQFCLSFSGSLPLELSYEDAKWLYDALKKALDEK